MMGRPLGIRSLWPILLLSTCVLVGCDDGSVVVQGTVTVDGEPLTNGRLMFRPIDGNGQNAYGLVSSSGKFQLRSAESKNGAFPGTYRVMVIHKPEITKKQQQSLKRQAAGLALEELTVNYASPKDLELVIPAEGTESLDLTISRKKGWEKTIGD